MLSAVILTKNEENNIIDCLESLRFCDEVIVIDDSSKDRTSELARSKGASVIEHSLDKNFCQQRNFGMSKAKNEWVLFIDADERVPIVLAKEILSMTATSDYDAFYIKRQDVMWGKALNHGELSGKKFIRLGRKVGIWEGKVHEKWIHKGKIGTLKNSILHYPHQSISEFLSEINFYTTIRAEELKEQKVKSSLFSIILYTKLKFFKTYFLKLGFLDGFPGLVLSLMMSFHSFLVRSKLWFLNFAKDKT